MSFFAQASDLPKARDIARRALRTINYREQDEKQNVWTALLNLENIAGTDESLEEAFKEAASTNDPKAMHQHMLQILEKGKKFEVRWVDHCLLSIRRSSLTYETESGRTVAEHSQEVQPRSKHLAAFRAIFLQDWPVGRCAIGSAAVTEESAQKLA